MKRLLIISKRTYFPSFNSFLLTKESICNKFSKSIFKFSFSENINLSNNKSNIVDSITSNQEIKVLSRNINLYQLSQLLNITPLELLQKYNEVLGCTIKEIFEYLNPEDVELFLLEKEILNLEITKVEEEKIKRPLVVTIMGHVDHGKTTLLDSLRNTQVNIADKEFGKITQTIGAFHIMLDDEKATIIDTPGHEAFAKMRLRGAKVTDCIILVISAVEGIKKQTDEVLNIILSNKIPFIIAFNKFDLDTADIESIVQQLKDDYNIIIEENRKKVKDLKTFTVVPSVNISAKYGTNIELLKKQLLYMYHNLNPKEEVNIPAQAYVIESKSSSDKFMNLKSSLLIRKGILKAGDIFICGNTFGKIKTMEDDQGNEIKVAYPGQAVEITGPKSSLPSGSIFCVLNDINIAEQIINEKNKITEYYSSLKKENIGKGIKLGKIRGYKERNKLMRSNNKDLWEKKINTILENGKLNTNELSEVDLREIYLHQDQKVNKIIIKADTEGVIETIVDDLKECFEENILDKYIDYITVGQVTEEDIEYAKESKRIIFCFNSDNEDLLSICSLVKVGCRSHKLVFEMIEEIKQYIYESIIENEIKCENIPYVRGEAMIKNVFQTKVDSKIVNIAGIEVESGSIHDTALYRVSSKLKVKGSNLKLISLKQNKIALNVIKEGEVCGIIFNEFNDFDIGDKVICYNLNDKNDGITSCRSYVRCYH